MDFHCSCPHCGSVLQPSSRDSGSVVFCPFCSNPMVVPFPSRTASHGQAGPRTIQHSRNSSIFEALKSTWLAFVEACRNIVAGIGRAFARSAGLFGSLRRSASGTIGNAAALIPRPKRTRTFRLLAFASIPCIFAALIAWQTFSYLGEHVPQFDLALDPSQKAVKAYVENPERWDPKKIHWVVLHRSRTLEPVIDLS